MVPLTRLNSLKFLGFEQIFKNALTGCKYKKEKMAWRVSH